MITPIRQHATAHADQRLLRGHSVSLASRSDELQQIRSRIRRPLHPEIIERQRVLEERQHRILDRSPMYHPDGPVVIRLGLDCEVRSDVHRLRPVHESRRDAVVLHAKPPVERGRQESV